MGFAQSKNCNENDTLNNIKTEQTEDGVVFKIGHKYNDTNHMQHIKLEVDDINITPDSDTEDLKLLYKDVHHSNSHNNVDSLNTLLSSSHNNYNYNINNTNRISMPNTNRINMPQTNRINMPLNNHSNNPFLTETDIHNLLNTSDIDPLLLYDNKPTLSRKQSKSNLNPTLNPKFNSRALFGGGTNKEDNNDDNNDDTSSLTSSVSSVSSSDTNKSSTAHTGHDLSSEQNIKNKYAKKKSKGNSKQKTSKKQKDKSESESESESNSESESPKVTHKYMKTSDGKYKKKNIKGKNNDNTYLNSISVNTSDINMISDY